MKLIQAQIIKAPRLVQTKYGPRVVADCRNVETGEDVTVWRPHGDGLLNLSVNSKVTLTQDSKGKINLVDNPSPAPISPKTDNKPSYQGMNPDTKREIASYVTEMSNLFNFCLKQVDMTVENISSEDRRAIATTMFLSAQKRYGL
jgi:WD40 repeat protein